MNEPAPTTAVEFFFDPICPYAYHTSVWLRDVRSRRSIDVAWRFLSLEEINRPEGKRHPWERPIAYGWTPLRVAAWLRRIDMDLCGRWYEACGRALHVEGRRCYDPEVARELLATIDAPAEAWDAALADPTTHDDVLTDHREAVERHGAFGVPLLVFVDADRALFGPVVTPPPAGAEADRLWDVTCAAATIEGFYEMKRPKTDADRTAIATAFAPYLRAREWETIERPAP